MTWLRLFAICFFVHTAFATAQPFRFDRLTLADGLSNNTVFCVHQDKQGFLWFGTFEGLNRYDGYEIKVYKHDWLQPHSLSRNKVTRIFEDKNQDLWVCDADEPILHRFERKTEKFKAYSIYVQPALQEGNEIESIADDEAGNVLVGTRKKGCFRYDPTHDCFIHVQNPVQVRQPFLVKSNHEALLEALDDFLKKRKSEFTSSSIGLKKIIIDTDGNYWVATKYDGLYSARQEQDGFHFTAHLHEKNGFSQVNSEEIHDLFEDRSHVVWIASKYGGVYRYSKDHYKFQHLEKMLVNGNQVLIGTVRAITEDKNKNLWIGTNNEGLFCLNRLTQKAVLYKCNPLDNRTVGHRLIRSLFTDSAGTVWVGHYNGFSRFNLLTQDFKRFLCKPFQPNGLPEGIRVYDFKQGKNATLWLAGWDMVLHFDPLTAHFQTFVPQNVYASGNVRELLLDDSGQLQWCIGEKGLGFFDTHLNQIHTKPDAGFLADKLPSNNLFHIFCDSKNRIWIGTAEGLVLFNRTGTAFTTFSSKDGLPGTSVLGILEDAKGCLWLTTTKGLSQFDPEKKIFTNYDERDGLQSNEFTENAFFQTRFGEMIVGGVNGINLFRPDKISINPVPPQLVITKLKISDKPVNTGDTTESGIVLRESVFTTKEIVISHEQRFFSLEFAGLHFVNPQKNRYAYKLEGFDEDWIYRDAQVRFATYTNLEHGTYYFRLKAANSDGVWNEEGITLKIVIKPPFYATWWFMGVSGLLIVGVGIMVYRRRVKMVSYQKSVKAMQLESELNFLKTQLNPHFLFNSLNNIYALCQVNSLNAAPMVGKLSEMMRYMIYECNADRVPLHKEIEYLNNYIELHQLKSDKELNTQLVLDGNIEKFRIVPMLLINFLENSFKHGDIHFNQQGYIFIHIRVQENVMIFQISNSFRDKQHFGSSIKGIGLENVKHRLNLLYPEKHTINILKNDSIFDLKLTLLLD